jgi:hypothetical protein
LRKRESTSKEIFYERCSDDLPRDAKFSLSLSISVLLATVEDESKRVRELDQREDNERNKE